MIVPAIVPVADDCSRMFRNPPPATSAVLMAGLLMRLSAIAWASSRAGTPKVLASWNASVDA